MHFHLYKFQDIDVIRISGSDVDRLLINPYFQCKKYQRYNLFISSTWAKLMFGEKKASKQENRIVLLSSYRVVLLCISDNVCQRLGNTYSIIRRSRWCCNCLCTNSHDYAS